MLACCLLSLCSHLDWSEDGEFLQSTDGANEVLYWNAAGRRMPSAADFRDTRWASWTLPLGWPVAGIWPANSDGTDVNAVDRAKKGGTFATADDFGGVKLFRWVRTRPLLSCHGYCRGQCS